MFDITNHCYRCTTDLKLHSGTKIGDLMVHENTDRKRKIFFSPVGNQFNFGCYNNNKTPRIVIMGITTSPTARNNFLEDFKKLMKSGHKDSFRKACILNIFNSYPNTLQRNLNKILTKCNLWHLVDADNFSIQRETFASYFDNEVKREIKSVIDNVYFTQMIFCASCKGEDNKDAPKLEELDDKHQKCISSQIEFFKTFSEKVDLLITFGDVEKMLNDKDTKRVILNKCKHHIKLSHPASARGWNEINSIATVNTKEDLINAIRSRYPKEKGDRIIEEPSNSYITQVSNCYDQYKKLKEIVETLQNNSYIQ